MKIGGDVRRPISLNVLIFDERFQKLLIANENMNGGERSYLCLFLVSKNIHLQVCATLAHLIQP